MIRVIYFIAFLISSSGLFGQEVEVLPVDSSAISIDSTKLYEQKIRKLEDSLLIEKTRRETIQTIQKREEKLFKRDTIANSIQEVGEDVSEGVGETVDNFRYILQPSKIIATLIILFLTWLFVRGLNWVFKQLIKQFPKQRLAIMRVQPIVSVVVWSIALFSLFKSLFGDQNLWAAFGASSLALGIGLQDMVKNIFGGLMILINRPFQIGDKINVKNTYGEVVQIGMQTTTIVTSDDNSVTVPNAAIVNDSVSNANSGALDCMVVVNLYLPLKIDVERVRKIAFEAAITSRFLNIDKSVTVLFFDHLYDHPATMVQIKAYVLDARYEKRFAGDITEAAKKAFSEDGIYT